MRRQEEDLSPSYKRVSKNYSSSLFLLFFFFFLISSLSFFFFFFFVSSYLNFELKSLVTNAYLNERWGKERRRGERREENIRIYPFLSPLTSPHLLLHLASAPLTPFTHPSSIPSHKRENQEMVYNSRLQRGSKREKRRCSTGLLE